MHMKDNAADKEHVKVENILENISTIVHSRRAAADIQ